MDKYQIAILRHESARALVSSLKKKRSHLINECDKIDSIDSIDDPDGFSEIHTGTLCLNTAFKQLMEICEDSPLEGYSYSEVLDEMHCDGECCDSCYQSYEIKVGPLADAKQEFGNAKRAISCMGKKIIRENEALINDS